MSITKWPSRLVLGIGVVLIVFACLHRFDVFGKMRSVKTDVSSMLTEAINIAELSTAEFQYRGIAEAYANEEKTKVKCRICYSAIVKAGIDMKDVKILGDDKNNKTLTLSLPPINLKVTIIDEESMATLPSDADIRINEMLICGEKDVEREARQSSELMDTAQRNLKATIEGLAFPILKPKGYSIIWA